MAKGRRKVQERPVKPTAELPLYPEFIICLRQGRGQRHTLNSTVGSSMDVSAEGTGYRLQAFYQRVEPSLGRRDGAQEAPGCGCLVRLLIGFRRQSS